MDFGPRLDARGLRVLSVLTAFGVICAASCDGCEGSSGRAGGGGGGSSTSSWLVGQGGLMLNVDLEKNGEVGFYPLDFDGDLRGIACWGPAQAWVAGDGGALFTTDDAGKEWRSVDVGVKTRLRAVARAANGVVYVAGEAGVSRVSNDVGRTWQAIPAPSVGVTWTAIAVSHDGGPALFTTEGGEIHRYDPGTGALALVATGLAGALHAVAVSHDGATAAAVGDSGTILISVDGGLTWRRRPSGTTRALRDVWLAGERGRRLISVGDGGTLIDGLTAASDGATPRSLGAELTLRALHLSASGNGAIVGDAGTMFVTRDAGASWSRVATGDRRDIFAVDALEDGPHL